MAQKKKGQITEISSFGEIREDLEGQFTLLPDIPGTIRKARGPVIDSVMGQSLLEQTPYLVDDTSETSVGKPLPIQTRVMLSYEGIDLDIQGRMKLTAFDREVIDAVASLALYNEVITPAMIYRLMMGKKEYQYVTPLQEKRVMASMSKCAYSKLQLDLTDLMEKGSPIGKQLKKEGISASYSGNLLSFETMSLQRGSRMVTCYRMLTEPAIIRYAASLGKISEFPIDLLDTRVSKTERNIVLQSFLLRCIDEMYREEDALRFIDIHRFYRAIDAEDDTPQHKARFRAVAEAIFEDWVQKGYIRAFQLRKAGSVVKGYEILLQEKPFPQKMGIGPRS